MGGLAGVGWDRLAFGRAVEGQLRGDQGGWEGRPGGRAALHGQWRALGPCQAHPRRWVRDEPAAGRMAWPLRHDGAIAAARGSAGGGRLLNRVSNRAVQLRKQNHSVRKRRVAKKLRRVPARARPCRHRSETQSWTACSAKANRFSVASRLARPWLPCPKLRWMLSPWRARQLNPSCSIFQRLVRPVRCPPRCQP